MKFQLSTKVVGVEKKGGALLVTVEPAAGGEKTDASRRTSCWFPSAGGRSSTISDSTRSAWRSMRAAAS